MFIMPGSTMHMVTSKEYMREDNDIQSINSAWLWLQRNQWYSMLVKLKKYHIYFS
jgi:hypothetical protein